MGRVGSGWVGRVGRVGRGFGYFFKLNTSTQTRGGARVAKLDRELKCLDPNASPLATLVQNPNAFSLDGLSGRKQTTPQRTEPTHPGRTTPEHTKHLKIKGKR